MKPLLPLLLALAASIAHAAPCLQDDMINQVSGQQKCLIMTLHRSPDARSPEVMIVWLHGDTFAGGPATSHVGPARRAVRRFHDKSIISIALWRPGYGDEQGRQSSGDALGRADNITKQNVSMVGDAIARLANFYHPAHTIVVGHSSGAATAAVLLGMIPTLIDGAVLVSCPCSLRMWRSGRLPWPRSEDPSQWVSHVSPSATVIAMTGTVDAVTSMDIAINYVEILKSKGINATFAPIPGGAHDGALRSPEVMDALGTLIDSIGTER